MSALTPDDLILFNGAHEAFAGGVITRAVFQRDIAALDWRPQLSQRGIEAIVAEAEHHAVD